MTLTGYLSAMLREAINQRAAIAVAAAIFGGFTMLDIWMGGSL